MCVCECVREEQWPLSPEAAGDHCYCWHGVPTGTLTGCTYFHSPGLSGKNCQGENATLKFLIKAEQSPEGQEGGAEGGGQSGKEGNDEKQASETL